MQMGRLIRLRPRRRSFYALEETVASLHEELQLTLNYAQAMVRHENYDAAVEVIEEQRRSLVRATERMQAAFAPEVPARREARIRVVLAAAAATLALAAGAFAAFGPATHGRVAADSKIETLRGVSAALSLASSSKDPVRLGEIVGDAQSKILAAALASPADPAIKQSLLESVDKLRSVLQNPNVPDKVREAARQAVKKVEEIVPDADTPEPTPPASTDTTAPKPEPSV
jgi:hypothetical protein